MEFLSRKPDGLGNSQAVHAIKVHAVDVWVGESGGTDGERYTPVLFSHPHLFA